MAINYGTKEMYIGGNKKTAHSITLSHEQCILLHNLNYNQSAGWLSTKNLGFFYFFFVCG